MMGRFGRLTADALTSTVQAQRQVMVTGSPIHSADPGALEDPRQAPAQADILARDALARMVQDTLRQLSLVRKTREAMERFGTVQVRVKDGHLGLDRPPLADEPPDPSPGLEVLQTRLLFGDGADLAIIWETFAGPLHSRVSYGTLPKTLTLSLGVSLHGASSVEVGLRRDAAGYRADACLSLSLP